MRHIVPEPPVGSVITLGVRDTAGHSIIAIHAEQGWTTDARTHVTWDELTGATSPRFDASRLDITVVVRGRDPEPPPGLEYAEVSHAKELVQEVLSDAFDVAGLDEDEIADGPLDAITLADAVVERLLADGATFPDAWSRPETVPADAEEYPWFG